MEPPMSHGHVERIIGRLATDESLRRRFAADPERVVAELLGHGVELNDSEQRSLKQLNPKALESFARALDLRLQKSELHRERNGREHRE
jgi:hypothetical protein